MLAQAGCLLVLAATAWAAGWATWGRRDPARLLHPLTLTIGLALLGEVGLLLAAVHLFTPWTLALVAVAAHAAATAGWRRLVTHAAAAIRQRPRRALAVAALTAGAAAGGFVIALYPPTAFDETTYHLPFARAFLAQPGLPWVPELRVPAFPLLAEGLQAALLALGGERAPHQLALLATLATAALLVAWGREAEEPIAGWLGAALFLGNPLVAYLAGTGYVDPLVGLFTTGAFYALWRVRTSEAATAWAATAGFLAGSAAAVKYLGLYAIAVGAVALLFARARRWRSLLVFGGAALVATALPYGYLIARTGNPLFPYFSNLFGTSAWEAVDPVPPDAEPSTFLLPYNSVFHRELAGNQPPLSPALLLGSLLLLVALLQRPRRAPRLRAGALVVLGFFPAYVAMPEVSRYLATVLPLWTLLIGAAATWAWRRLRGGEPPRRLAAALALALAVPGPAYGAYSLWRHRDVPLTPAERDTYLAEVHRGYGALAWLQERQGRRYVALCFTCEHLHGFAAGRLLGEHSGPWAFWQLQPLLAESRGAGTPDARRPRRLHPAAARRRGAAAHARGVTSLSAAPRRRRFRGLGAGTCADATATRDAAATARDPATRTAVEPRATAVNCRRSASVAHDECAAAPAHGLAFARVPGRPGT